MNRKAPNFDTPLIGDRNTLSAQTRNKYDREKRESNEANDVRKNAQQAMNRLVNQERLQNNTLNTHKNRARNLENEIKALEAQEKAASQARNYTQAANFKNQLEAKKRVLNSTNQSITWMQRTLERTKTALSNARTSYQEASRKYTQEYNQFIAAQRAATAEYQKHIEGERLQREASRTLANIHRLERGNATRNRQIQSNNATISKNAIEIGNLASQIQRLTRDIQTLKNNPEVKVAEANQLSHPSLTNLRTLEGRLRVITQRKAGLETQNTNLLRQNERIKTETDRATASLNAEKQKQERFAAQAKTLGIHIA